MEENKTASGGESCAFHDGVGQRVDITILAGQMMASVSPHEFEEGETYTNCVVQTLKCRRCGHESFAWSKTASSEDLSAGSEKSIDLAPLRRLQKGELSGDSPYTPWSKRDERQNFNEDLRDFRQLKGLLKEIEDYTNGASIKSADQSHGFLHNHESVSERRMNELHALGIRLLGECPENDCGIFRNIFKMTVSIDEQLGKLTGYAREVMEAEFGRKLRELEKMYLFNYAVKEYRKEAAG